MVFCVTYECVNPQKKFKSYDELVDILSARNLDVGERDQAIFYLGKYGYHRLAGYRYPFREFLPTSEQDGNPTQRRSDMHVSGSRLSSVIEFHDFDVRLRNVLSDGLESFEVSLRSAIAYTLASRDPLAHLKVDCLDAGRCATEIKNGPGAGETAHAYFCSGVRRKTAKLKKEGEDFVVHHSQKYESELPVWAVVEYLDFGELEHLLRYMKDEDQRAVAQRFGVRHPNPFRVVVKAMRELRNMVAHGARTYNKPLKTIIKLSDKDLLVSDFVVLALGEQPRPPKNRVYTHAVYLAHMLTSADPDHPWPRRFVELVSTYPDIDPHIPDRYRQPIDSTMGFSASWKSAWPGTPRRVPAAPPRGGANTG